MLTICDSTLPPNYTLTLDCTEAPAGMDQMLSPAAIPGSLHTSEMETLRLHSPLVPTSTNLPSIQILPPMTSQTIVGTPPTDPGHIQVPAYT